MADFNAHIEQAGRNLEFLSKLADIDNYWDWKVTVSFYSALHLINAHVVRCEGSFYRSHVNTDHALNPNSSNSASKLSQDEYLAYRKLQNFSKRARYLVHDDPMDKSIGPFLTNEKHYSKALRHLNTIISFLKCRYNVNLPKIQVKCCYLNQAEGFENYHIVC